MWSIEWQLRLPLPRIKTEHLLHIAKPGKDQSSKFKVGLLPNVCHFHTIVQKTHKLNHHKLGQPVHNNEPPKGIQLYVNSSVFSDQFLLPLPTTLTNCLFFSLKIFGVFLLIHKWWSNPGLLWKTEVNFFARFINTVCHPPHPSLSLSLPTYYLYLRLHLWL